MGEKVVSSWTKLETSWNLMFGRKVEKDRITI